MTTGDKIQRGAERLLADIREIKAALAEEDDPDEQRHLRRLLKGIHRKVTRHCAWLESLRKDPRAGTELEAQIALFIMLEHECRLDEKRERPVRVSNPSVQCQFR
jgi:hypothetical protein